MKVFQLSKLEQMPNIRTRRGVRRGGAMTIPELKKQLVPNRNISDLEALKIIIDNKTFEPTIVNPESKFVVVTYWWGRGNKNMNTARPCPDERKEIIEDQGMNEYVIEALLKKKPGASEQEKKDAVLAELREFVESQGNEWRDPITYDEMIAKWENECRRMGCNYVAVEYPEFAVQKGYQLAINAKPLFIAKALEMCGGRGVLYIDGDMYIKQYPAIFDLTNVDYMARAWECDPRASYRFKPLARFTTNDLVRIIMLRSRRLVKEMEADMKGINKNTVESRKKQFASVYEQLTKKIRAAKITGELVATKSVEEIGLEYDFMRSKIAINTIQWIKKEQMDGSICYDPYVFQTSGGTMFFGHTEASKALLAWWEKLASSAPMAGKADDRVISMMMQQKYLFTLVNFISLPIEFLWLTGNYETYMKEATNYKQSDLVIEHPECLTSEEAAAEQGASSDRSPKFYTKIVDETINCERSGGVLYEQSYFGTKETMKTFRPYLEYMKQLPQKPLKIVGFDDKFADNQKLVSENHAAADGVKVEDLSVVKGLPVVTSIAEALAVLRAGNNCAFIPEGRSLGKTFMDAYNSNLGYELIAVNIAEPAEEITDLEAPYKPVFSLENPIIFKAGNDLLVDMLSLCRNFTDLTKVFNSGFMWLYRIRSKWVAPSNNTTNSAAGHANAATSAAAERTLVEAANARTSANARAGGVRRRTLRRRQRL